MRKAETDSQASASALFVIHRPGLNPTAAQVTTTRQAGWRPELMGGTHYTLGWDEQQGEAGGWGGGGEVEEFTPKVLHSSTIKGPTLH